MTQPFSVGARVRSFRYAVRGLRLMLVTQHNARVHAVATVGVVGAGLALGLSREEWCWVILAVVGVWTAEAVNTSLEFLCDVASPEFHPLVERSKDVAAAAVLITAIGAAAVGALTLGPRVISIVGSWANG